MAACFRPCKGSTPVRATPLTARQRLHAPLPESPGLYSHFPLLHTAGLAGLVGKIEIRNPKSETNSNQQRSKSSNHSNQAAAGGLIGRVLRICHLNLVFVSDFEFRISDLSSQGSGENGQARHVS